MDTYFASPQRKALSELKQDIEQISNNPIVDGLMRSISGLFAVLNSDRQILAVNHAFLDAVGLSELKDVLGLRPGEALKCVHAWEEKFGCGTSKYCSTCGAALAIVTSLARNKIEDRYCAAQVRRNGSTQEICLKVRAVPFEFDDNRYVLLFIVDVSDEEVRTYMERIFYHDVNNMIAGLVATSEVMLTENEGNDSARSINCMSWRLKKEFDAQRLLAQEDFPYEPYMELIQLDDLYTDLRRVYCNAPFARDRTLHFVKGEETDSILTDYSLLMRVLMNMVTNACEATEEGCEIRIWHDKTDDALTFHVWNATVIPQDIQRRIFQRHFSTKSGKGKGLGTYSMKLLGEKYLGGKVSLNSAEGKGTTFSFSLPK